MLAKVSDPYCQDSWTQGHDPGVPGRGAAGGGRCACRPRLPRARLSGTQARGHFTIFCRVARIHEIYGSRSADPYLRLMDPNPAIFVSDSYKISTKKFFAYYFLLVHLHNFSKIKCHKEITNQ
jgi:hypothetical protein